MSIFDDKEKLIEIGTADFMDALEGIDQKLALKIIQIYTQFVQGDTLVINAEALAQIEQELIAAIAGTNYKVTVDAYIPNFEALAALNVALHKIENDINAEDVLREADKIRTHLNAVESTLRGMPTTQVQVTNIVDGKKIKQLDPVRNASLNELIDPIADVIRQDVIMGVSFESATEAMLDAISKKQLGLEQWAGQIARDALSQHDGIMQEAVAEEFELEYFRYLGTIEETTRPVCFHLLTTKSEPVYTKEEIEAVLNEFAPGGIPAENTTTETANGKPQRKGNGIIPGTDAGNFIIRRGGYNCRHSLIPSRLP